MLYHCCLCSYNLKHMIFAFVEQHVLPNHVLRDSRGLLSIICMDRTDYPNNMSGRSPRGWSSVSSPSIPCFSLQPRLWGFYKRPSHLHLVSQAVHRLHQDTGRNKSLTAQPWTRGPFNSRTSPKSAPLRAHSTTWPPSGLSTCRQLSWAWCFSWAHLWMPLFSSLQWSTRKLRQPLNYILVNISLAGFIFDTFSVSQVFVSALRGYYFLGETLCALEAAMGAIAGKTESLQTLNGIDVALLK